MKLTRLLPESLIERLAEKYETSAGGITLVLKNTAAMKPRPSECEKIIDKLPHDEAECLSQIPDLAPGDFRTVRQSLFYLDANVTNAVRIDALKAESMAKAQSKGLGTGNRIGFSPVQG